MWKSGCHPASQHWDPVRIRLVVRGNDDKQAKPFSFLSRERQVPAEHLLRAVKRMADEIWCYGHLVHDMRHVGVRPLVTPNFSPRQIAEAMK